MIQYKVKNTFSLILRIFGFIFIGFGLILLLGGSVIGFSPVIIGAVFGFTFEGIQFDLENARFKEFTGFLGLKKGKWKSCEDYPFVSLLNFNVQSAIYSLSNSKSTSNNKIYRLYMLNTTHFEKILIKEFKSQDKAEAFAKQLVQEVPLDLVPYSPRVSAASRSRKR